MILTLQDKIYLTVFSIFLLSRVIELIISSINQRKIVKEGALYPREDNYNTIKVIHIFWFVSQVFEFYFLRIRVPLMLIVLVSIVLILTHIVRLSTILSLGKLWTTKICTSVKGNVVKSGLYSYVKHPNYAIVFIELFLLPIMGGAFFTAVLFTLINFVVLMKRVKLEEKFLSENSDYKKYAEGKNMFFPDPKTK